MQEVVRGPHAIEANSFRLLRDRADRIERMLAVVFAAVRQGAHQSDLHGLLSAFITTSLGSFIGFHMVD